MSAKETIKRIVDSFNSKPLLKDKTNEMGQGLMLGASLADDANELSKDVQAQVDQLVVEGDSSVEAAQARVDASGKSYTTLKKRLDEKEQETTAQFQQYTSDTIGIAMFPRLPIEITDLPRINRAIDSMKIGQKILIPSGEYELNGLDLVLRKTITILGGSKGTTIFKNGGIVFEENDITVERIYVDAPLLDNGFEGHNTALTGIKLVDCISKAKDHSYLFESYQGVVEGTVLERCISLDSVHGFISKAKSTIMKECSAYNHSGFGFGVITDNIPSVTSKGEALFNTITNCYAKNCLRGFTMYNRNKFESVNTMSNDYNVLTNFTADGCSEAMRIGEDSTPDGYLSVSPTKHFTASGIKSVGTAGAHSMLLKNVALSNFSDLDLDKPYQTVYVDGFTKKTLGEPSGLYKQIININNNIDVSKYDKFDCYGDGENITTTNKISVNGTPKIGQEITIMVRSKGGSFTYGGFGTMFKFSTSSGIKTTLAWGEMQTTRWMYTDITNTWTLVSLVNGSFI